MARGPKSGPWPINIWVDENCILKWNLNKSKLNFLDKFIETLWIKIG